MKKKILIISFTTLSVISSLKAVEVPTLTGDAKLACEAILCLSSPTRPNECIPALKKFFSIGNVFNFIEARKGFLSLCPVANESKEMKNQIDSLSRITGSCTIEELNANIESKFIGNNRNDMPVYAFRTSPKMTSNCEILSRLNYGGSEFKFKYTCEGKFYTKEEWDRGYELKEVSKKIYESLPEKERGGKEFDKGKRLRGKYNKTKISLEEARKLPDDQKFYNQYDQSWYQMEPLSIKKQRLKKIVG